MAKDKINCVFNIYSVCNSDKAGAKASDIYDGPNCLHHAAMDAVDTYNQDGLLIYENSIVIRNNNTWYIEDFVRSEVNA